MLLGLVEPGLELLEILGALPHYTIEDLGGHISHRLVHACVSPVRRHQSTIDTVGTSMSNAVADAAATASTFPLDLTSLIIVVSSSTATPSSFALFSFSPQVQIRTRGSSSLLQPLGLLRGKELLQLRIGHRDFGQGFRPAVVQEISPQSLRGSPQH